MEQPYNNYRVGFRRVIAALFDGAVVATPLLAISANTGITEEDSVALFVASHIIPIVYSVLMHYKYGQTLGKMAVGIKVIDVSETRGISLKQAILRDSAWIVLQTFSLLSIGGSITQSASSLWALTEIITMFTNSKRRALHDFIAGTVVVRVKAADSVIA
ncbi:RDD family protein [Hymenobacter radiodurans]|uniref:RDD family protein n=1 Tax=Hymenobacter radiodurans TaxID=2496028 RepID=UPI001058DA38|nr:RDD family protein [Hymenobacter radiodurans]